MTEQVLIDSLDFVRNTQVLRGKIAVALLPRVQDVLFASDNMLEYTLSGYTDKQGRPFLHCEVNGVLQLRCQRCLEALTFPVDVKSDLMLVKDEAVLAEINENEHDVVDAILANPQLDVFALIEDEILLDLPMSPKHPPAECKDKDAGQGNSRQGKAFEALAVLKAHNPK